MCRRRAGALAGWKSSELAAEPPVMAPRPPSCEQPLRGPGGWRRTVWRQRRHQRRVQLAVVLDPPGRLKGRRTLASQLEHAHMQRGRRPRLRTWLADCFKASVRAMVPGEVPEISGWSAQVYQEHRSLHPHTHAARPGHSFPQPLGGMTPALCHARRGRSARAAGKAQQRAVCVRCSAPVRRPPCRRCSPSHGVELIPGGGQVHQAALQALAASHGGGVVLEEWG